MGEAGSVGRGRADGLQGTLGERVKRYPAARRSVTPGLDPGVHETPRREIVLLGKAAVDFAAHVVDEAMRRVRLVVDEPRAVHGCTGAELIGKFRRRGEREPAAEAITDGALRPVAHRLAAEELQHRAD